MLLGSGEIYSGLKLERVAALANRIDDAVWFGGTLTTVRTGLTECELQQWSDTSFTQTRSQKVEGYPLRLASLPGGQLLLVTLVHDRPRFHLLDAALAIAFQSSFSVPPAFTTSPASAAVVDGDPLVLSVGATGDGPLAFQWYHNGIPLTGANETGLAVTAVGPLEAGLYDCAVTDKVGSVLSRPAVVGPKLPAGVRTAGSVVTRPEWQDIHHSNGAIYDQVPAQRACRHLLRRTGTDRADVVSRSQRQHCTGRDVGRGFDHGRSDPTPCSGGCRPDSIISPASST
ncbi:MAG: hypothetical protein IPL39_07770 [Opitutaceae bacterium]|nr:hypothetical protein [Opitutaceae bacterium]